MRSALLLSALVAGVLSAPLDPRELIVETATTTVWVTVTPGVPGPSPAPVNKPPVHKRPVNKYNPWWHPRRTTVVAVPDPTPVPSKTPTPVAPAPAPTTKAPAPATTTLPPSTGGSSNDGSPTENGISWLQVANKFRGKAGKPLFKWNTVLAQQATDVGNQDGGDISGGHHGDFGAGGVAQVLAGGSYGPHGAAADGLTNFDIAYASWLCEVPSDPILKSDGHDYCAVVKNTINMQYAPGQTGHYNILSDPSLDQIGCSFVANKARAPRNGLQDGLWTCNLCGPGSKYHQ